MKKRIILLLAMFVVSVSLIACGSQKTEGQETTEAAEEVALTPMPEETVSPKEQPEKTKVPEKVEEQETVEEAQVEEVPIWYMDEEGIKSEELGMMMRRDSAEWSEFGFSGSYMVNIPSDDPGNRVMQNFNFQCNYYEGNIDNYILENEGMEKVTFENIDYAVKEPENEYDSRKIAIVGDGIVLSITLWDKNIEDIWKAGLGTGLDNYEGDKTGYLAYIENKILYCPALGIKFSGDEEDVVGNYVRVHCSDEGGYIDISNNEQRHTGASAKEMVDEQVKYSVHHFGDVAIEETIEMVLGNQNFVGGGCSSEYGSDTWWFISDETPWEIVIWHKEEYELEKFFPLIENISKDIE